MAVKFDYQDAINTAEELIDYFGMDAVLRREGSSPEDRPCRVVLVEFTPRERAGELTNPTDRKVIMSAKNEEVQLMPPDNEQDVLVTFVQKPTGGHFSRFLMCPLCTVTRSQNCCPAMSHRPLVKRPIWSIQPMSVCGPLWGGLRHHRRSPTPMP